MNHPVIPSPLVLASSSSYRKALLSKLGLPFAAAAPAIDESPLAGEGPLPLSARLAREKAAALKGQFPHHLIIGSDQVAMLGDRQLHKPGTAENAARQLQAAAGKSVEFFTSVCVFESSSGRFECAADRTVVHFRPLSVESIERYVAAERPYDCAGGFKSEGLGIVLFERLDTEDPNALVGLPLIKLTGLLARFGLVLP